VDFGVIAEGVDLGHLSDADFATLREAVYRHHVVVVRGQSALTPPQQLALTHRFDGAATEYGHGSNMELMKASVLTNDLINLPSAPEVKLLGNGPVAEHDGLKDLTLKHPMHFSFHKDTLPADDYAHTRFYRWHIDAALYGKNPPHGACARAGAAERRRGCGGCGTLAATRYCVLGAAVFHNTEMEGGGAELA